VRFSARTANFVPHGAAPSPSEVAEIDLKVPADARLWVRGVLLKQTGAMRFFVTPPLRPGVAYSYEVRAAYRQNGADTTTIRTLTVGAGDRLNVALEDLPKIESTAAVVGASR
jgi:uncharacterized protein (TIGR03000 family)